MKDAPRQSFRNAPHVSGTANAKPRDYELQSGEFEADSEYALWSLMRASENPLGVGDLLELPDASLRICKYVGFDDARWFTPEPPPLLRNKPDETTAEATAPELAPVIPIESISAGAAPLENQ